MTSAPADRGWSTRSGRCSALGRACHRLPRLDRHRVGVIYLTVAGGGGFFGLYSTVMRTASVGILSVALLVWIALALRDPALAATQLPGTRDAGLPRRAGVQLGTLQRTAARYGLCRLQRPAFWRLPPPRQAAGPSVLRAADAVSWRFGRLGICLLYTVIVFSHWVDFWSELGRFSPPPLRPLFEGLSYGNPSTVATVVALSWLAAAAHFGFSTTRSRLFLLVFGLLVAWVVLISGSRGAWAGLAIATLLVIPLMLLRAWIGPRSGNSPADARLGQALPLSCSSLPLPPSCSCRRSHLACQSPLRILGSRSSRHPSACSRRSRSLD